MSNVALNKPILEKSWVRPENLTDGNYKNYDGKIGYTHSYIPVNLTVDLQGLFEIEIIRFLLWDKDGRSYKYRLLTSTDLKNWSVHYSTAETGNIGWQEFSFEKRIIIRYIRIHCLWNSNGHNVFHIVQLQAFDCETENIENNINFKKVILSKSESDEIEINDGLPLTQKMNFLIDNLEVVIKKHQVFNPLLFQEIISNFRTQSYDIETLEKSIDSVRREIINPVKNELEKGNKLGKFSVLGFYVGFVGIIISILTILNGVFNWI